MALNFTPFIILIIMIFLISRKVMKSFLARFMFKVNKESTTTRHPTTRTFSFPPPPHQALCNFLKKGLSFCAPPEALNDTRIRRYTSTPTTEDLVSCCRWPRATHSILETVTHMYCPTFFFSHFPTFHVVFSSKAQHAEEPPSRGRGHGSKSNPSHSHLRLQTHCPGL